MSGCWGLSILVAGVISPLILSLSKDKRVVRQAHHERVAGYYERLAG